MKEKELGDGFLFHIQIICCREHRIMGRNERSEGSFCYIYFLAVREAENGTPAQSAQGNAGGTAAGFAGPRAEVLPK
ncbi:MAG: hypothetical protein ACLS8R_00650 [Anaeromassilibacillus sp.]